MENLQEELENIVKKWMKRLRLNSWDWKLVISETMETGTDSLAEVVIDDDETCFEIHVKPTTDSSILRSYEGLLLHELLHVVLYRLLVEKQSKSSAREEERVVNKLTKSFLELEGKIH